MLTVVHKIFQDFMTILKVLLSLQVPSMDYLRIVIGEHSLMKRDLHEHSFLVDKVLLHNEFRKSKMP